MFSAKFVDDTSVLNFPTRTVMVANCVRAGVRPGVSAQARIVSPRMSGACAHCITGCTACKTQVHTRRTR